MNKKHLRNGQVYSIQEMKILLDHENPINPMLIVYCCFQYGHGHGNLTNHRPRVLKKESEYCDHSVVTDI